MILTHPTISVGVLSLDISHGLDAGLRLRGLHASRAARVFRDTGETQPSLTGRGRWHPAYPALTYRAKVITSLRDLGGGRLTSRLLRGIWNLNMLPDWVVRFVQNL